MCGLAQAGCGAQQTRSPRTRTRMPRPVVPAAPMTLRPPSFASRTSSVSKAARPSLAFFCRPFSVSMYSSLRARARDRESDLVQVHACARAPAHVHVHVCTCACACACAPWPYPPWPYSLWPYSPHAPDLRLPPQRRRPVVAAQGRAASHPLHGQAEQRDSLARLLVVRRGFLDADEVDMERPPEAILSDPDSTRLR